MSGRNWKEVNDGEPGASATGGVTVTPTVADAPGSPLLRITHQYERRPVVGMGVGVEGLGSGLLGGFGADFAAGGVGVESADESSLHDFCLVGAETAEPGLGFGKCLGLGHG